MPPMPFGYEGRDVVTRFCASLFAADRRFDLIPARANGQPAFGAYLRAPTGTRHATAFYVLTLAGDQIRAMTRFEASVLPWFGLPRSLPAPVAGPRGAQARGSETRTGGRAGTSTGARKAAQAHVGGKDAPAKGSPPLPEEVPS